VKLPRGSILIVASHNPGKVREIKALLGPHGIEPLSAKELGLARTGRDRRDLSPPMRN
jgi:inosine/xanthosine triphosphate pyrophosphatase family protein